MPAGGRKKTMNPELTIEISDLGEATLRQEIFSGFERLAAGQTLELVSSVPAGPECFLAEFQNRYGQGFDWWPLGNRSHASSVLVTKRTTEPRTISAFLGNDHHRLTERWDAFVEAVKVCEQSYENLFIAEKVIECLRSMGFGNSYPDCAATSEWKRNIFFRFSRIEAELPQVRDPRA